MSEFETINCTSCVGACCRAHTSMALNTDEVAYLEERGATLYEMVPDHLVQGTVTGTANGGHEVTEERIPVADLSWQQRSEKFAQLAHDMERFGFEPKLVHHAVRLAHYALNERSVYELQADCPNYDPTANQCLDYENRPEICKDFEMGGESCQEIRQNIGIDPTPVQLIDKSQSRLLREEILPGVWSAPYSS